MSPGEFARGDGLVDIHCHALPGVDAGAASVAMGHDMLRRAADEGVDDVVLTPHYRPEDGPERAQQLQDYFEGFAVDVADAGIGVRVHLAAELGFRFGLAHLAQSVTVARLAGGPYVLVDLPPGPLSPGLEQAFFEIRTAGYRPVLAHPERHRELAAASVAAPRPLPSVLPSPGRLTSSAATGTTWRNGLCPCAPPTSRWSG